MVLCPATAMHTDAIDTGIVNARLEGVNRAPPAADSALTQTSCCSILRLRSARRLSALVTQVPEVEGSDWLRPPVAAVGSSSCRVDEPDDSPRNILRLRRCPECDYNLRSLPERHRCPECGFEYDPTMFALYGWPPRERLSAIGRVLMGAWWERILGGVLLLFVASIALFQAYMFWRGGLYVGVVATILFLVAILDLFRLRPHVRRSRVERWGPALLLFTSDGASMRRGPGEARPISWKQLAKLSFRRFRSRKGRKRLWHIRLTFPFWRIQLRRMEAIIECTPREAALIRSEIRRRMRAARKAAARELSA